MPNKPLTEAKEAKKGADGIKTLINNHKKCLDELQEVVEDLQGMDEGEGELMDFIGVRDAEFAVFEIRALYRGEAFGPEE